MEKQELDPRLRLAQQADMKGKIILVRVDHNVVKEGLIKDPYRIDATLGTLYAIAEKGGRPILMTHVGRPKDKKTGKITCQDGQSVGPIARYLEQKLPIKIHVHDFPKDTENGIMHLDESIKPAIEELKNGRIGMIYLPNTRWFQGEQSKGPEKDTLAKELAAVADIYVNDAFGSWQAHVSTYDIASLLPSFAGMLLQKEIINVHKVLNPGRPFVAVIAGAKYDTKIGPLKSLYAKVDHLILGGLIYNTFLAAKYGVEIAGVSDEDKALALELVELDKKDRKIVEMPCLVESDTTEGKTEGAFRSIKIHDFKKRRELKYLLDIETRSLEEPAVKDVISSAKTIFVNAVMGLMPSFFEGSQALYRLIVSNRSALKLFGGGDTLQELRNLCPGAYMAGLDAPDTYYFTGGGSVLTAIEQGSPYHLKPVEALLETIGP
ncbi:MAG: phosphoglycerate kinase [Thermodesulfobacteriota bacterium]|nr:phosphoglycerate kinase [Thermodesulfobacteriota bacterium]